MQIASMAMAMEAFYNVVITAHQAFFTRGALHNIAQTTLTNIRDVGTS